MIHITLRKVESCDIEFLWYLRNRPDVYCYFLTPKPGSWEEHVQWIMPRILGFHNTRLSVIEVDHIPAGQIRIDQKDSTSVEISISLLEEFRGKGVAKQSLRKVIDMLCKEESVATVVAEIHKQNIPSQKLFEGCGFQYEREQGAYRWYALPLLLGSRT